MQCNILHKLPYNENFVMKSVSVRLEKIRVRARSELSL